MIRITKHISLIFFSFMIFVSCSKDQEPLTLISNAPPPPPTPPYVPPVQGTSWTALPPSGNYTGKIKALQVYNSYLHISGEFLYLNGNQTDYMCKYDGSAFTYFPFSTNSGPTIHDMCIYNTNLIGGGNYTGNSGASNLGIWNGTTWVSPSFNFASTINCVYPTQTSGMLIVGGTFTSFMSVTYNHIAYSNGFSWYQIGNGFNGDVNCITEFNGELYACGNFTYSGSNACDHIAKWNGSSWIGLNFGLNGNAYTMAVYNSKLYAGGSFTQADGYTATGIASWDGASWSNADVGVSGSNATVTSLLAYNGALIVGGDFTDAGSATHVVSRSVAIWNDAAWYTTGADIGNTGFQVNDMAIFNSKLYIGCEHNSTSYGYLFRLDP